jgi:hypothetical protein
LPDVTDEDVQLAVKEAAEAQELLAELERAAVEEEPDKRPTAAAVLEQRHLAEFATRRVAVTRERAEATKAAQRLEALRDIAAEVDAFAASAEDTSQMRKALSALTSAARAVRDFASEHDQRVTDLRRRAKAIGVEAPALDGPRATSAHLLLPGDGGIGHGRVILHPVSGQADRAITTAIGGDSGKAWAIMAGGVEHRQPRLTPKHFIRGENGAIHAYDQIPPGLVGRLKSGELTELTQAEAQAILDGIPGGNEAS